MLGSHAGLSHFLTWQRETFEVGPGDRCAQLTGISFDVVLRDIFLPLVSGATLHLLEDPDDLGGARLIRWLADEEITLLHTVPALTRTWLATWPAALTAPTARAVFFAGEPLTGELVNRWRSTFPRARVINLYGPTETTLAKCAYEVPVGEQTGVLPIGWALPQTQILLLNAWDGLCGIGEVGEIVVRTPFRTKGYLSGAPSEAVQRFCPNPFTKQQGDIVYRTGDRGRYGPGGRLEILSRLDDDVKIRGVLVNLRDVEAMLGQQSGVQSSVVTAHRGGPEEEMTLAAYVVPAEGQTIDLAELRASIRAHLPAALAPATVTILDHLPLTANGKVDRTALPRPERTAGVAGMVIAPRTRDERQIAEIWVQLLGMKTVSVHDNFFDVGGTSLLAIRVCTALEEATGLRLPAAALWETPTIAQLAMLLGSASQHVEIPTLVALQSQGSLPPLFCISYRGGPAHAFRELAAALGPGQPVYALQEQPRDRPDGPARQTAEVAAMNIDAMRAIQPHGPYYLAGTSGGGVVAYEMAQQLRAGGEQVAMLALFDTTCPGGGGTARPAGRRSLPVRVQYRARALATRIRYHTTVWTVMQPVERPAYLRARITTIRHGLLHVLRPSEQSGEESAPINDEIKGENTVRPVADEGYRPRPYAGHVTYFWSSNNPAGLLGASDPRRGWQRLVQGRLEIHYMPGRHCEFAYYAPYLRHAVADLQACLRRARRATGE